MPTVKSSREDEKGSREQQGGEEGRELGGGGGCADCDTERSSISTTSSQASSTNGNTQHWTANSAMKLSKFGRRIRDSCRNLKGRQNIKQPLEVDLHNPEDYSSIQLPNESVRSKVYVAMDFSGRQEGKILDNPKDVRSCVKPAASKDGYVPFRRRVAAPVAELLTETQATIHKDQPWFHGGMSRDVATKILQFHANIDGVFLVRESSVAGGYVISYTCGAKHFHSQVLPLSTSSGVVYSVDDGKTKFYDLLQLVEYYQLNTGTLPTRLNQYIVSRNYDARVCGKDFDEATPEHSWQSGATASSPSATSRVSSNSVKMRAAQPSLASASPQVNGRSASPGGQAAKMATSSASEGESAMSQDGGSEDEASSREQQG